ncbi:MAG: Hsp20/alpha crystallin family protein [Sedimentisphaerales bacterium]|nr:Hsp20/alpha crystallin family protein [Sedimentisphaerales bacterium]
MALGDLVPWKRRQRDLDVRRDYGSPFQSLAQEMNRLFDDFRGRFDIEPFGFSRGEVGTFMPNVDITENDKEVQVTCELPGIDEKNIDITLSKDSITIKGEKKQETENQGRDYYRMERSYGSFQRMVPLPAEIDEDKTQAEFKKGVLIIKLPKTAEAQRTHKRIEVKSG